MSERIPELLPLLEAERRRGEAPEADKVAARARLLALLGPSSGLDASRDAVRAPPPPRPGLPASVAPMAARGVGAAKLLAAFALGGVTVGAVMSARTPAAPSAPMSSPMAVPHVEATTPTASASPRIEPPAPSIPSAATARPPAPVPRPAPPTRPGEPAPVRHDLSLTGERALLERARSALARGDGALALAAADEHARSYPKGQLSEEREALAIQALVASGRRDDAAERAGRFRREHPTSVLLPVVDEALR